LKAAENVQEDTFQYGNDLGVAVLDFHFHIESSELNQDQLLVTDAEKG
jgi:hypothetical protein